MKRYSKLILTIFALLTASVAMVSCGLFSDNPDDTSMAITSTSAETTAADDSSATTTPPETALQSSTTVQTTLPETTQEPATPGLTYESTGDGFCYVSGILDQSATRIVIPEYNSKGDYVLGIKSATFFMNTAIKEVVIPENVDSVGAMAFYGCTSLESVVFEEGCMEIESGAFQACTALKAIHIPASVDEISTTAFYGCHALKTMTVDENNEVFRSEENCIIHKESNRVYMGCSGSRIPKSVSVIGDYAFYYMGLTEMVVPDHVTAIGAQAFAGNAGLTAVALSESLVQIGDMAFANCTSLTSIYIPKTVTAIGTRVFQNCNAVTTVTVDPMNEAFFAEGLCLVDRRSSTLVQGFRGCIVPDGVKKVGDGAFFGMLVTQITLPDGVTEIGARAFANCSALTEMTISKDVIVIDSEAFQSCEALHTITFGGSKVEWRILTINVTFPDGVTVTCLGEASE